MVCHQAETLGLSFGPGKGFAGFVVFILVTPLVFNDFARFLLAF